MRHDVTKQVETLVALTGKTEEAIAKKYDLYGCVGSWEAFNRPTENRITMDMNAAKRIKAEAEEKAAFAAKMQAGCAVWRNLGGEWLVQVTGQDVQVGDMIEVERKNGTKSEQIVKKIVTRKDDSIYCRV
jgi:hypothetical protein